MSKNYDMSHAISNALKDKKYLKETANILKRFIDGEPKNINPIKEMPKPEMVLYRVHGKNFDTKDELEEYCKNNNIKLSKSSILEYYRNFASRSDVIRNYKEDKVGIFYSACDEDGYGIYNFDRSIYRGEFIWEYNYGHIRELYDIFRDKGIIFENDIYAKIDERHRKIMEEFDKVWYKKRK